MFIKFCLIFVLFWHMNAQMARPGARGSLTGFVKGENGTTISGAVVLLRKIEPSSKRIWQTEWQSESGSQGTFRFNDLPDGKYSVCARVSSRDWLNPCEWGFTPEPVAISHTKRAVDITIVMKKAVALQIRVEDPNQWLSRHERKTPGAHLLIAAIRNQSASLYRAHIPSEELTGRGYELLVPFDVPVKIVVASAFFHLSDAAGLPLSKTGSTDIPVLVPAGRTPSPIWLIVTGGGR